MMINIKDKKQCCGCYACINICPQRCINMVNDIEGFLYPNVQINKCTNCGLCEKACPYINARCSQFTSVDAYAVKNKDETIRYISSSGGVFSILSEYVLKQGGAVFGAALNQKMEVVHQSAEDITELSALRGSKYVQSRIGSTYYEVKKRLVNGQMVLFSGTPCQITGLNNFLDITYDNLISVDFVCHGTSSPLAFQKYIEIYQKEYESKISKVEFRNKRLGWRNFSMHLTFENQKEYIADLTKDMFLKGFLSNLYLRPSCHACIFKNFRSNSDLTLADYWGVDKLYPEFDDDLGVSLVFANSIKGKLILKELFSRMEWKETTLEQGLINNSCITTSVRPHKKRDYFFTKVNETPFNHLVHKCLRPPMRIRIRSKLKETLEALNIIK